MSQLRSAAPYGDGVISARSALALMGLVVAIWGINWPVMKIGLAYIPPFTFALARFALGAACLFAVLAATGRLRLPGRADAAVVLSVGLLQLAVFLALTNLGLMRVDAGRSAILCYTTLLWVAPLAALVLGERLTGRKALGIAAGLGGIAVLFNPLDFDWSDRAALIGNGCLLGAALAWAIAILHVRGHRFALSPLQLAPWQMVVAMIPLAALALLFEDRSMIHGGPALWAVLAYNGPIATAFTLWAWLTVNRALPATTTAAASLGVPVVGLLAAAAALGDALDLATTGGLALIVGGIALITIDRSRQTPG